MPTDWAPSSEDLINSLNNVVFITVHPGHVSPAALSKVNTVIVVGREPKSLLDEFARTINIAAPEAPTRDLERGQALVWFRDENRVVPNVTVEPGRNQHQRHKRKYAEGALEEDRSFYFTGPKGSMNLRAQNLNTFVQLADGVDAETWLFHLKRHDYSTWLRQALKDSELAAQVESIEGDENLPEGESRKRVKDAILQRYSAPA